MAYRRTRYQNRQQKVKVFYKKVKLILLGIGIFGIFVILRNWVSIIDYLKTFFY
jgi:hypothetical protein